jgi:SET domain-containing protein
MRKPVDQNVIEAPESDYLYIQPSQISGAGKGLYTAIDIFKGEIISIFKGERLTERQVQLRVDKDQDKYFIELLDGSIIDSMKTKCFAKYANDARGASGSAHKNNAQIALDEEERVGLIATKNIKAHQEIFCSYGKRYWRKHG